MPSATATICAPRFSGMSMPPWPWPESRECRTNAEGADEPVPSSDILGSERQSQIAGRPGQIFETPQHRKVLRVGVPATEIDRDVNLSPVSSLERHILEPGFRAVPLKHLTDQLPVLWKHELLVPDARIDPLGGRPLDHKIGAVLPPRNVTREVDHFRLVLYRLLEDQLVALEIVEPVRSGDRQALVRRPVQHPSSRHLTGVRVHVEVLLEVGHSTARAHHLYTHHLPKGTRFESLVVSKTVCLVLEGWAVVAVARPDLGIGVNGRRGWWDRGRGRASRGESRGCSRPRTRLRRRRVGLPAGRPPCGNRPGRSRRRRRGGHEGLGCERRRRR